MKDRIRHSAVNKDYCSLLVEIFWL